MAWDRRFITISNPGEVTGYEISLKSDVSNRIDIPGGSSLDLSPQISTVPEPSSLLVIGAAGALMTLRHRKKRA